ncbi:MAG: TonB-dependent receptor plug domain-containing protein, partial [Bacteroidetes bacterium]|nr:TonB-dependent receptor plug domain-containing protein [Bacteroidota bacterium]
MRLKLLVLFFIAFSFASYAQSIRGVVTEKSTGQPIGGVSVLIKNSQRGTVTDPNGNYSFSNISQNDVLVFSFIGYRAQEITYTGQQTIDITLLEGLSLNEVVVTALGLERNTKNLGYAIQKVDGRQINDVKAPNFLDNLTGKVAGVTINSGSTGVGSSSKITIRGESSFTNNNPLFVVDGIPINNNTIVNNVNDDANGFMEVDFGNGGMEVNPDDIASVSVLKGPSAAALYGTRASNGVILITTKDGSQQKGLGVSFNSTLFTERPFQLAQFQNLYGQGNNGQFKYVNGLGGGINDNISYSYGPKLDA